MNENEVRDKDLNAFEKILRAYKAEEKKKWNWKSVVVVLWVVLATVFMIFSFVKWRQAESRITEISYEPVETETDQFYPGRAQSDYSDTVFDMNSYLNSIGATEIQRAIYQTNEGTVQKLIFNLDNFEWRIETTIFHVKSYGYGICTSIEAKDRISGRIYHIPTENCGTLMMDSTSPFWFDRLAFDVFHIATDPDSELKTELREHLVESECPFYGLGIPHYDKDPTTGDETWHNDLGSYTVEEGLDLYY